MKIIIVLLLFFPNLCSPEIYVWRDSLGNRHYSDKAKAEASVVHIKPGIGFSVVKRIYDGDTVELEDGRKIRLLGIDTPEIKHKYKQAESGGDQAKQWLEKVLKNTKVQLITDVDKTDKYGRTLAHLFTEDKKHINLELIASGLAHINIFPPNLLYADQLLEAQNKAEQSKLGIWSSDEYVVKNINPVDNNHSGWVRLIISVSSIRQSRKYLFLVSAEQYEIRIERKWLSLFPDIQNYLAKTIEVRGWITKNQKKLTILVRHPSALKILP